MLSISYRLTMGFHCCCPITIELKLYLLAFYRINLIICDFEYVSLLSDLAGDKMEKNEMGWACGAYG